MSDSGIGPTWSPSTTRCQPLAASAGATAGVAAASFVPRTTMMWLHFLHRILKTFPRTLSSEIEYLVPQESQTIFINASFWRRNRSRDLTDARRARQSWKVEHYIEPANWRKRSPRHFPRDSRRLCATAVSRFCHFSRTRHEIGGRATRVKQEKQEKNEELSQLTNGFRATSV